VTATRQYAFTRETLMTALTQLEIRVSLYSPETLKIDAGSMADAIIGALGGSAESPAVKLLEEALFLRTNGEYAPGGTNNWHDWDSRAEVFLRGLLPPEAGDSAATDPRA
jgi:hypothetical protein